jgi:hypothetical protein
MGVSVDVFDLDTSLRGVYVFSLYISVHSIVLSSNSRFSLSSPIGVL